MARVLVLLVASATLATCAVAGAAAPAGFTAPQVVAGGTPVIGTVVAADAAGGQPAAVAFSDGLSGHIWAARVRADGSLGSPLPAASGQSDPRDLQVAVTDRGELVVVWAAVVSRRGPSAI